MKEAFQSLDDLKLEQGTTDLDTLPFVLLPHLKRHVLLAHQSPKFGIVVQDVKLAVLALYVCVFSWDRNVSDSNFTLMTSAELDPRLRCILHYHNTLFFFTGSLKNQIGPLRPVQSNQLLIVNFSILVFHLNEARKFAFADFALKFSKIIVLSAPYDVLFDFDPDPLREARVVHRSTGSIAFARVK